ncbi:DUF2254 domain-containing protein [Nonlabens sp. YIK11]|uniref:DUF2254 domain-containing protein n=1 Tax=Nonlabens sp. YIK11 TaxID=1453349 RepID=UPI000B0AB8FB|nr:DUF2254 family protein [Nonlabens sp. YIK11]
MLSTFRKIYNSIALLPTGIALFFALMAIGQISFPFNDDYLPDFLDGIVILEKGDLQFIFAFIIGGIFTLTIFSYTMVMNVLNRSISNYSPRLIPLILSERHHQLILGFTSGTIIYSMIMSIAASGDNVQEFPPLGAFVGVMMSILCVFLFIYFIHSVSQSIHVNYILRKSYDRSLRNQRDLQDLEHIGCHKDTPQDLESWEGVQAKDCGYVQLPDIKDLADFAKDNHAHIYITRLPGTFIYDGEVLIRTSKAFEAKNHNFSRQVSVDSRVPLELNETEIKHLVEVAIKGSSPAINDPGTSLGAIDYITQLLIKRGQLQGYNCYSTDNEHFVYIPFLANEDLAAYCFEEMWNYMKQDPILVKSIKMAISTLNEAGVSIHHGILK